MDIKNANEDIFYQFTQWLLTDLMREKLMSSEVFQIALMLAQEEFNPIIGVLD